MIAKQEITDFAREFSLPVNTIEKDYVLGWLLACITIESLQDDNDKIPNSLSTYSPYSESAASVSETA